MLISLDISTSCTGVALFGDDNKLLEVSHIKFKQQKGSNNLFVKLDEFVAFFEKYNNLPITEVVIEENLKKYKGKFSNATTIEVLAKFNAMISMFLYQKFNIEPVYYNTQTARSLALPNLHIPKEHPHKKNLVLEAIQNMYSHLNFEYSKKTFKFKDESYDMADAIVVGLAHIVSKIKAKEQIAKNSAITTKS